MSRAWHKGPPPFIGWWNASISRNDVWRWWDGKQWSDPVDMRVREEDAEKTAKVECDTLCSERIEWTTYWPKNARAPRIWPDGRVQK